jgi:hypothetical protein
MTQLMYALTASTYSAIFLVSIIVLGDDVSRNVALAACLACLASQYTAQDEKAWRISIGAAYVGFVLSIVSLITFTMRG